MTSGIDNASDTMKSLVSGDRWRTYVTVALVVSFISYFFVSDGFNGYRADASLLVMSKGQTGSSAREIAENVMSFSKTDAFHTAFLSDAESIPSFMAKTAPNDLSNNAKRTEFDTLVSLKASDTGSTIIVSGYSNNPDDASAISRSASLTLSKYASRYYNIKEEADFRIVDGPTVSHVRSGVPIRVAVSVAVGIAFTAVFSVLVSLLTAIASSVNTSSMTSSVGRFSADMFLPKRPSSSVLSDSVVTDIADRTNDEHTEAELAVEAIPEARPILEESKPIEAPLRTATLPAAAGTKKSTAPLDLPIYSEEEARFLQEFSFEPFTEGTEEGETIEDVSAVAVAPVAEPVAVPAEPSTDTVEAEALPSPTKEEYQRRLNQLLRG